MNNLLIYWRWFVVWVLADPDHGVIRFTGSVKEQSEQFDAINIVAQLYIDDCEDIQRWKDAARDAANAAYPLYTEYPDYTQYTESASCAAMVASCAASAAIIYHETATIPYSVWATTIHYAARAAIIYYPAKDIAAIYAEMINKFLELLIISGASNCATNATGEPTSTMDTTFASLQALALANPGKFSV